MHMMRMLGSIIVAAALIRWPATPPPAPSVTAVEHYFGHAVIDPYRNLENLRDPAVQAYLRRETEYTDAVLANLGAGRETIRREVVHLNDAGDTIADVAAAGRKIFYLDQGHAGDARLMIADESGKAKPRVLLDPDALAKSTNSKLHLALDNVAPSPDGKYVAVGVVPGGAENDTDTRIVRVADGAILPDHLRRTWFGINAWSPDDKVVFYNQFRALLPGESTRDRELGSIAYRHEVGTTAPGVPVFGPGATPGLRFQPTDLPFVAVSPISRYAFGVVLPGTNPGEEIYVASLSSVLGNAPIVWRKIAGPSDQVTNFDIGSSTIFMLSFKNASRYKIVALDLNRTNETAQNGKTVVPASDVVLQQVAVAQDGLYVRGILGGLASLRKLPFRRDNSLGHAVDVSMPFKGAIPEFATDPKAPGAVLGIVSWIKPLRLYALNANGTLTDTRIRKPLVVDTSAYTTLELKSQSADGTNVPLSIVMRKDTKLDGTHPTYIEVYGAFGEDIDPYFLGERLAWLDHGGVWAVVHARGGGEYGEDWHRAGAGSEKNHTVEDLIGAARYLIAHGYTSSTHLAIGGTSAGTIAVGEAITSHPELFAAALDIGGVTDPLRLEVADPNGPANAHEYGSLETASGFASLYAIDPYQHLVDGRQYPSLLAVTGINDPFVAPWQPVKFAARLQADSSGGRPVLLRVDYGGGHGLRTASRSEAVSLLTDELSFLLWQCGSPLFAAIPQRAP